MPQRVVFLDETAVKTNLTRLRGWAPRSERLTMDAPFGSWGTQTLIAGLTPDALIAPWVIKGAMDGPAFAAYVREVLIPEIAPGTAVILDNLATHRNKEAARALRAHGCWFLYLPPDTILRDSACLMIFPAFLRRMSHCTPRHSWRAVAVVGSRWAWSQGTVSECDRPPSSPEA